MTDPRLKKLGDELTNLEQRAGIAEKVADANLGPLFPNLDATSDEYFKDVADHARRRVRNLYFALEDLDLRKQLIRKRRECDSAAAEHWQDKVIAARQKLSTEQSRTNSLPWTWAGCVAVLCVAVGAYSFQLYGAIGGALMGFFLAQGSIAKARSERETAVREAQEALDEALQDIKEMQAAPDWFNASEAIRGERDEEFDFVSIYDPPKA